VVRHPAWLDPQDADGLGDVLAGVERGQAASEADRMRREADRLSDPADVELGIEPVVVRGQQDEHQGCGGEMLRVSAEPAQTTPQRRIGNRQESPRLPVPRRAGPARDLQELLDVLLGDGPAGEAADGAATRQDLQQ
jgi:hypothetical protein